MSSGALGFLIWALGPSGSKLFLIDIQHLEPLVSFNPNLLWESSVGTSKHCDFPPSMSPRAVQGGACNIFKTKLIVLWNWQKESQDLEAVSRGPCELLVAALTPQLTPAMDHYSTATWRWPASDFKVSQQAALWRRWSVVLVSRHHILLTDHSFIKQVLSEYFFYARLSAGHRGIHGESRSLQGACSLVDKHMK